MEEVRQFEEHHPIGGKPRLALALTLSTGQRRSDIDRPGLQHIQDSWMTLAQVKNRERKSVTSNSLGNWFRKLCDEAGLTHCSAHGLHNADAALAAEDGATER